MSATSKQVWPPDLDELLGAIRDDIDAELVDTPEVVPWTGSLDVSTLPLKVRRWIQIDDVVAVVADLKGSTLLGTGKHAGSTASIYEAGTENVVTVFHALAADFIQIQGDGAFALFWGEGRFERALCAGISVKTFSEHLVERLRAKWPDSPETGFKVGVASGRVLVKRVGTPRNPAQQEPLWAGKPVNYATKAAQQADRHDLIITGPVWDRIEANDYLTFSCPCMTGPSDGIWSEVALDRLPTGSPESQGRVLKLRWCPKHGAEYFAAVLAGQTTRSDVEALRKAREKGRMARALAAKDIRDGANARARRGL